MLEKVKRYNLANIYQISCYCNTNLNVFIHSKTLNLWNNEALTKCLTHILGKLIQDLQSWDFVHVVSIVCQFKGQFHNVFFIIILDNSSDVKQNIDGLILDLFILVVEQLVKHSENFIGSFILLDLRAFFLHKLDQWDKLVEKSYLNFALLARKNV